MAETLQNSFQLKVGGTAVVTSNLVTADLLPPLYVGTKVQAKASLRQGETQDYTCTAIYNGLTAQTNVQFSDVLDENCSYVPGSFKVNGALVTPTYDAGTRTLTYTISSLVPAVAVVITFQVQTYEA